MFIYAIKAVYCLYAENDDENLFILRKYQYTFSNAQYMQCRNTSRNIERLAHCRNMEYEVKEIGLIFTLINFL